MIMYQIRHQIRIQEIRSEKSNGRGRAKNLRRERGSVASRRSGLSGDRRGGAGGVGMSEGMGAGWGRIYSCRRRGARGLARVSSGWRRRLRVRRFLGLGFRFDCLIPWIGSRASGATVFGPWWIERPVMVSGCVGDHTQY